MDCVELLQESAFKQVFRRRIVQFPDMEDVSTLYLAHQRLIERFENRATLC